MAPPEPVQRLIYGDNLPVLREQIAPESVALIYLDPPFNSNVDYNILFREPTGKKSEAQIHAFQDTWHWNQESELALDETLKSGCGVVGPLLLAMVRAVGRNDLTAYLAMMAVRLVELHRVLKPTGSIYLHCDPAASHYLKLLMDGVFGARNYRSEISWKRSSAHSDAKQGRRQYGNIRDVLLFYTKSNEWTFNWQHTEYDPEYVASAYRLVEEETGRKYRRGDLTAARPGGDTRYPWRVKRKLPDGEWTHDLKGEWEKPKRGWEYKGVLPYKRRYWAYSRQKMIEFAEQGRLVYAAAGTPEYKRYLDEMPGVPLQNDWQDIPPALGKQALGYPTQKPLALLDRIIETSSHPGDVMLDPFCGCGTSIHAAHALGRQWVGIDVTHLAISLIEQRMKAAFPGLVFEVLGTPKDVAAAQALAARDKYQFQWWAISLVGAVPLAGKKKGKDTGIDGAIYFRPNLREIQRALVSVKGGASVNVAMIRDFRGVLEREEAPIGVFISLAEPTADMRSEAAAAGFLETAEYGKMPRLQLFTIAELLDPKGPRPQIRGVDPAAAFKIAAPHQKLMGKQGSLL